MPLEWRIYDPCPATHPLTGSQCEREADDHAEHWYTVWERDPSSGENLPSYPVGWSEAVRR